jgi:Domain of unknown function (DUF222)
MATTVLGLSVVVDRFLVMSGGVGLVGVRAGVVGTRGLLGELPGLLYQGGGGELGVVLEELDALSLACDAAKVAVVAEALARGETSDGAAALSPVGWVRAHAPSTVAGGARLLVDLAAAFGKPVNAPVAQAVASGRVGLRSASVVLAEVERLRPRLVDGAEPAVVEGLLTLAAQDGPRGCRRLRPALLARYGLAGQLQAEQDTAKRFVALSQPLDTGTGVVEYRLALDTEGSTVLEAALGPLTAPQPTDGKPDLRGSDRRRGDALLALVSRAVTTAPAAVGGTKAQLFVTVDYTALRDGLGAGTTVGGPDAGTHLAPETVRRLACDASLIPLVLGGPGQVLDHGTTRRLFTPAQTKRLWLRDGGCTYPGCTIPPQWTDAHHLLHWADGGPTNLANAALLCQRHHTLVHQRRHAGRLHTTTDDNDVPRQRVQWDRTRGSYDTLLAERQSRRRA